MMTMGNQNQFVLTDTPFVPFKHSAFLSESEGLLFLCEWTEKSVVDHLRKARHHYNYNNFVNLGSMAAVFHLNVVDSRLRSHEA